jgi:quercetin dioxygenase-like cupin family protein
MLIFKPVTIDDVARGGVYTFEKAGDVFPTHEHTENDIHITIVAHGAIEVIAGKSKGRVLEAKPGGTIVNWKPHEPHGFIALHDGTTIINLLKKRR